MHWDAYTICSVASGATLVVLAVAGVGSTRERMVSLVAGLAFAAYGIYVAKQTSGTYFFPIYIFVLPIIGIVNLISRLLGKGAPAKTPAVVSRASERRPIKDAQNGQ